MTAIGDTTSINNETYRFEAGDGVNAYRWWTPWGTIYQAADLATAKAAVPIDDSIDERVVILVDESDGSRHFYVQKAAGYGATFDLSFDEFLDTSQTYVNSDTIDALLAAKDISALSGMTSTSAQVEAAIVLAAAHAVILNGISNADLTDAKTKKHTQHTDTGTTATSFKIQSGGNYAEMDAQNLTGNTVFDLLDLYNKITNVTEIGYTPESKTKAQIAALSPSAGDTYYASDIGATEGHLLTYDGTDWISGVFFMQDSSNTIATSPSVGVVYYYAAWNTYFECLDATAGAEVFMISADRPVTVHTATGNIASNQMQNGHRHTNEGAAGAVVLTLAAGTDGDEVIISKVTQQNFTINPDAGDEMERGGAGVGLANTAAEKDKNLHLLFLDGNWQKVSSTGTWA